MSTARPDPAKSLGEILRRSPQNQETGRISVVERCVSSIGAVPAPMTIKRRPCAREIVGILPLLLLLLEHSSLRAIRRLSR